MIDQLRYTEEQVEITKSNIDRLVELCLKSSDKTPKSITAKLNTLEEELENLQQRIAQINIELAKPTVEEVSFDDVRDILNQFAEALPLVEADKQKALLHSIIEKITVNPSNDPKQRSIKDIELVFDASPSSPDYVVTYDTVPLVESEMPGTLVLREWHAPSGGGR